jgi:hypothetical protein
MNYADGDVQMPWMAANGLPTSLTFDVDCSFKGVAVSTIETYPVYIHVCADVELVEEWGVIYNGEHTDANDDAICDVCEAELACKHAGLTAEAKKDATCTAAGYNAYWYCADCEVSFADATAETVIEDIDAWKAADGAGYIAPLGHIDADKNHSCDRECGKNDMGTHADSATDKDHVCDYGCGEVLEKCSDAPADGDHKCDICGAADVTVHTYGEWETVKDSTCTDKGEKKQTCSDWAMKNSTKSALRATIGSLLMARHLPARQRAGISTSSVKIV